MASEAPDVFTTINGEKWYHEINEFWPGQALSLKVDESHPIVQFKSEFQDVCVFKNKGPWGMIFSLDGSIMTSDKDECAYSELMAHLPLFSHPDPKKVLIIGGGDGGVLREVVKHPSVESVTLCDIDKACFEIARQYLPNMSVSFDHPKATVLAQDGLAYLSSKENEYDVIITDAADPDGPASSLFGEEYFRNLHKALKPGGIVCSQGENMWIHMELIAKMMKFMVDMGFKNVNYGMIQVPTYPCGSIGALIASVDQPIGDLARPVPEDLAESCKYYNADVHKAAFAHPNFVRRAMKQVLGSV